MIIQARQDNIAKYCQIKQCLWVLLNTYTKEEIHISESLMIKSQLYYTDITLFLSLLIWTTDENQMILPCSNCLVFSSLLY